jgi:hypothetical protein
LFELLSPISLLALTALALPILLHLRKDNKGKTLAVGSLALFGPAATSRAKSRRLSDWLLLLIRCALIITLSLLLAKPVWRTKSPARGWLLIPPGEVHQAYTHRKAWVDSMLAAGFALHAFDLGFAAMSLTDTATGPVSSYWTLADALQRESPSGRPLYLLTSNRLASFRGTRPFIASRLHWETYAIDTSNSSVAVDTVALSVILYGDERYVRAALQAIQDYTGRRIRVSDDGTAADWLFWLSDKPLPEGRMASHIFCYAPGNGTGSGFPAVTGWGGALRIDTKDVYRFYGRFDPAYSDLPWSPAFPALLMRLLYGKSSSQVDFRTIDPAQLAADGLRDGAPGYTDTRDLSHLFWLAALLLFITERLYGRRKEAIYG